MAGRRFKFYPEWIVRTHPSRMNIANWTAWPCALLPMAWKYKTMGETTNRWWAVYVRSPISCELHYLRLIALRHEPVSSSTCPSCVPSSHCLSADAAASFQSARKACVSSRNSSSAPNSWPASSRATSKWSSAVPLPCRFFDVSMTLGRNHVTFEFLKWRETRPTHQSMVAVVLPGYVLYIVSRERNHIVDIPIPAVLVHQRCINHIFRWIDMNPSLLGDWIDLTAKEN